jgi:hypothetical protein
MTIDFPNIIKHVKLLLGFVCSDNFLDNASNALVSSANPFNPFAFLVKDNLSLVTRFWKPLAFLLEATNKAIETTTKWYYSHEAKVASLTRGEFFWINDGILESVNLASFVNLTGESDFTCYQSPDFDIVVTASANTINIHEIVHQNYKLETIKTWSQSTSITIPQDFDIHDILTKQNWLVIILKIKKLPEETLQINIKRNRDAIVEKVSYLLVYRLDKVKQEYYPHFCLPMGGVHTLSFCEDNSRFGRTPAEKSRIDETLFVLMSNMDIYEIYLPEMKFIYVTSIFSKDGSVTESLQGGIKLVKFRARNFTVLTNEDRVIFGPLEAKRISTTPDGRELDADSRVPRLASISLKVQKGNVKIIDIAEQCRLLAIGLSNGNVIIMDKDLPENSVSLASPLIAKDKSLKGTFTIDQNSLVKLVFNRNDEILFFSKRGDCLSWKLNIPK